MRNPTTMDHFQKRGFYFGEEAKSILQKRKKEDFSVRMAQQMSDYEIIASVEMDYRHLRQLTRIV